MKVTGKYVSLLVGAGFAALLLVSAPALAATAPPLGTAAGYAVVGPNAVTCTTSTINGNVGTQAASITSSCTVNGSIDLNLGPQILTDINAAKSAVDSQACTTIQSGTLAGVTLAPGVHCFTAGAALTGLLTLDGPSTGIWVFKIGTSGTGDLAGTNFQVVMAGGGQASNVYWRSAQAATMTTSNFIGTILAGTFITVTGGTYTGRALATTDVTVTDVQPMTFAGSSTGGAPGGTTFTTQASPGVVKGGAISDTATLSGGVGTPGGTITFTLYGPNDGFCTGTPAFTSAAVPVSGNGTYSSGSFTTLLAGTYRWIANYSGDTNNAPIVTACNATNETVVVSAGGAATTGLTTQAQLLGGAISDTATLSGGASPTGTITFNLYGPDDDFCTGATIFTSVVPVDSGNGLYSSASFRPSAGGTYRWIANYSGDAANVGTANACNAVDENVVVTPIPTLSEWAMIMMAALLVLFGVAGIRRHAM